MGKVQCFKAVQGSDYDKAVKEHFELRAKWGGVFDGVSKLLGEKITKMAFHPTRLVIDRSEIENEETLKLFRLDGEIKSNSNKAKDVLRKYKTLVIELGLSNFKELRDINFKYGVMRTRGQELESFVTGDSIIYFKADFDLAKRSGGNVTPISEIEYQKVYLSELEKRKAGED